MSDFIFGLIWNTFAFILTYGGLTTAYEKGYFNNLFYPILSIGLLGYLWFIGLKIMFRGLKIIVKDTTTKIKGEICYGKIIKIYKSNIIVNDKPQLKANFLIYVASIDKPIIISEVIGYDYKKYKVNDLLKLKYYNKDINIVEKIEDEMDIPSEFRVVLNNPESLDKAENINITKK